ncbi:hypothetical protein SSYRP_v1c02750 [Spiroplasma syrphidicola EA-1]|uniref:Uncharacterized protein n=1 Tax=Spiroplasma syrphidicola EA-1 TaxID=1276229 RepID=R4UKS8_9MOLU|nr:hypothetical protein [Spiroplasma syrphidicola]AGM25871.1 hypothetical protein SSYRP_v1c02750 [Spiroplasma syrphidicola EA-1]
MQETINFFNNLDEIFNQFVQGILGDELIDDIRKKAKSESNLKLKNFAEVYILVRNEISHYSFFGTFIRKDNVLKSKINKNFEELLKNKSDYINKLLFKYNNKKNLIYKNEVNDELIKKINTKEFEYLKAIIMFLYYIYDYGNNKFKIKDDNLLRHLEKFKNHETKNYYHYFLLRVNNLFISLYNLFKNYFSINRVKICEENIKNYDSLNLFNEFKLNLIYKNNQNKIILDQNKMLKYVYKDFFYTVSDKKAIKEILKLFYEIFSISVK